MGGKLRPNQKWILPAAWIIATLLVAFVAARYIFPDVRVEKKFFGLTEVRHYSFQSRIFWIWLTAGIVALIVWTSLNLIPSVHRFLGWFTEKVLRSPWFILVVTATSGTFYVLGLTRQLFISEQFFFLEKEITLLNSIRMLFDNNEHFLGTIIFIFTIIFPILKYLLILVALLFKNLEQLARLNHWMSVISKWSMLDVYIVALLLLNMKFDSRIVNMELQSGVIWFCLSILLIMAAMLLLTGSKKPN